MNIHENEEICTNPPTVMEWGTKRNQPWVSDDAEMCTWFCLSSFAYTIFREEFFLNRPIKNKNCLLWPC